MHLAVVGLAGGINFGAGGLSLVVPDPSLAYTLNAYANGISVVYLAAYLSFVGVAVRTPLARPLQFAWVRGLLYAVGFAGAVADIVWAPTFIPTMTFDPALGWTFTYGWPITAFFSAYLVALLYTIPVTIDAWRRAPPGTTLKARARAYLTAFLLADVSILIAVIAQFLPSISPTIIEIVVSILFPLAFVTFAVILLRGMVRYQLFDFDLKVKWTLQRGTIAAIILGGAIVAGQVAQDYLSGAFGWLAGGVVAGLLIFAIKPIERFAEGLTDRAMPRTTGTPEYLAARKHEIYRAAIEDAMRDGVVSAKERALLLRLAENLQLSSDESIGIERSVVEAIA
jgi:hypothetical protein